MNKGEEIYKICKDLFPICRSLTGNGVRETLGYIKNIIPELEIKEVPTGTKCFDWTIPREWNINNAYIITPDGDRICDFKKCNLHVLGYSTPIERSISLSELQDHLFSTPEYPNSVPYVTSYYQDRWGFCISDNQRKNLKDGIYHVFIDSNLSHGSLTYGELLIKGKSNKEIFLSTNICHPSMANNELSGVSVTTFLAKSILENKNRNYSYRIIFIPETIGSIYYLSKNIESMQKNIIAGFNVVCVGDNKNYSFMGSRDGNTLTDNISKHVLNHFLTSYKEYSFLERGSDERQYCVAGVDLPVVSIMRSKYGEYTEYHTSKDDLNFISPDGLNGSYNVISKCIEAMENNSRIYACFKCEPQLGRRGLYSTIGSTGSGMKSRLMTNILAYSDGRSLLEIAETINVPIYELYNTVNLLEKEKLIYKLPLNNK